MRASVRYSLARVTIFLACLLAGWLLGLRNDPILLVLSAGVVSMFVSIFVLRGMREEFSRDVAERVEGRARRAREKAARRHADGVLTDEEVEEQAVAPMPRATDGEGGDAGASSMARD